MRTNPVFREGIQIYFSEGYGFPAYFYLLIILAPVELMALFLPSLDVQIWTGSANLFKVSSITALILMVYFGLKIANQEFAPWRFYPIKRWLREERIPLPQVALAQTCVLALHVLFFAFLCAPLLIWAGAIARTHWITILSTLLLLVFYALTYGVWGLGTATLWENRVESRQVFVRCFFFAVVFLSALLYLPINPVAFVLAYLGNKELTPLVVWGWKWSATSIHFLFHLGLLASGLLFYRWALRKGVAL